MGKTDDYVIILGLLGLGYMVVKTPQLRKYAINSVVKPIIQPVVVRSGRTLPVTSGLWSFLSLGSTRTKAFRSRYTVG
jgi:hypothetical protein